ncbi:TorF family putative porin [Thalassotalea crassostreae]|uniref:TorF family putative porin n=1 Tax=Thalassotalea crassostreae TaxID=1763536 RepID=UPI000839864A|nr:TorF family putative porin [Thalassotalea crassostreae]
MKKAISAAILASTLTMTAGLSTSALAVDGLSANAAVTSNYLWRGLEQTGGQAAVSGGIDFESESGFYVGTWASDASWAPGMTYELDFYGGFSGSISDNIDFDLGFIYFAYPDETSGDADFAEVYGSVSFSSLTLGVAVLAEGEGADAGDSIYASADYSIALGNDAEIALHVGSYTGDWLAEESVDYGASLNKDGFTFGVSATDLEDDDVKVYVAYAVDIDL